MAADQSASQIHSRIAPFRTEPGGTTVGARVIADSDFGLTLLDAYLGAEAGLRRLSKSKVFPGPLGVLSAVDGTMPFSGARR